MERILELFFLPPLAIGRLGGGDTPLESFRWAADMDAHDVHRTTIEPAVTLTVGADGTPLPYLPSAIRFRDGDTLRPVAPFFELWVRVLSTRDGAPQEHEEPLTLDVLHRLGVSLSSLRYRITMGNKKAQRRTGEPSCGFLSRVDVAGDDHLERPLLATSPHNPGEIPLVHPDRPIPLGRFQVVRPIRESLLGVDLSVVRVRYTPGRGEVYGPPDAIVGVAKSLQEGRVLPPKVLQGRQHEIVPPRNRILNPDTAWSRYILNQPGQTDPQPCDSYDGAATGHDRSWGVIDDTCDGTIEAELVVDGQRLRAMARVFAAPPDYSPDRRPFLSLADDLADRDLPPAVVDEASLETTEAEITDLFQRIFEVATQINLDLERMRAVGGSGGVNYPGLPQVDYRSMTRDDVPYVDLVPTLLTSSAEAAQSVGVEHDQLPYTTVARVAHAPMTDVDTLLDFLRTRREHVQRLVRPPFGRLRQFAETPGPVPNPEFRDPRVVRDSLQDMRMPPYMRDSDENPLSLTWRQYDLLMKLLQHLGDGPAPQGDAAGRDRPANSRLARQVADVVARLRGGARPA